jgi:hypothetical protein
MRAASGRARGRPKVAELYPAAGKLYQPERDNKVKKHILVALASVVVAGFCCGTASAQPPGGQRGTKLKKPKTATAPAGPTRPAPPGKTKPPAPAAPSPEASAKGDAHGFKEVTKEKFKEVYFRLGGGKRSGWTAEYWQKFFENNAKPGWKFMVEEPRSPKHVRMFIVTDNKAKEYRLFFMTEEDEEDSSDWPGGR